MTQLAMDLPEEVFSALRLTPSEFAREMRIAAAVQPIRQALAKVGE